MSVTSLSIKDLFNYLSTHFVDKFIRLQGTSFSQYLARYDTSDLRKLNDDTTIKIANLSKYIELIFEKNNPLQCGENAIAFIDFIKHNKSDLNSTNFNWISENLANQCCSINTTLISSPLIINDTVNQSETHNSSTQPPSNNQSLNTNDLSSDQNTSSNLDSISSFILSLRSGINSDMQSQIKLFMLNSLPKSAKDEHYQELEKMINQKIIYTNSLTINKAYFTNKILQKTINKSNFPSPYMANDPDFVDRFDKLINNFQVQIQELNISFLEEKLNKLTESINLKLEFIKQVDHDATDKCNSLESFLKDKHNASLKKSMEKINRKINEASNPALLQDSSVNISNSSSNKTTINSFTSSRNKSKRNSTSIHHNSINNNNNKHLSMDSRNVERRIKSFNNYDSMIKHNSKNLDHDNNSHYYFNSMSRQSSYRPNNHVNHQNQYQRNHYQS